MSSNPYKPPDANLNVPKAVESVSPEMMAIRERAYRAYVQEGDYVDGWRGFISGGNAETPFNWYAAFFGATWCCFRKMYVLATVVFVAGFVAAFLAGLAFFLLFPELAENATDRNYKLLAFGALVLFVRLPLGWWANWFYYRKASRTIQSVIDENLTDNDASIARIRGLGGTSVLAAIAMIALNIVANYFS
jgi:Protein of unknown function (DUF2628)